MLCRRKIQPNWKYQSKAHFFAQHILLHINDAANENIRKNAGLTIFIRKMKFQNFVKLIVSESEFDLENKLRWATSTMWTLQNAIRFLCTSQRMLTGAHPHYRMLRFTFNSICPFNSFSTNEVLWKFWCCFRHALQKSLCCCQLTNIVKRNAILFPFVPFFIHLHCLASFFISINWQWIEFRVKQKPS